MKLFKVLFGLSLIFWLISIATISLIVSDYIGLAWFCQIILSTVISFAGVFLVNKKLLENKMATLFFYIFVLIFFNPKYVYRIILDQNLLVQLKSVDSLGFSIFIKLMFIDLFNIILRSFILIIFMSIFLFFKNQVISKLFKINIESRDISRNTKKQRVSLFYK